ncbi:GAF domain-containing protein [Fulvivirgaceae bacterium BMA12]|uniref:GAF domain-containing protein n=1 Tax=Agaribacillus aureus TaxID=3051825 RepID=A0ABT8L375_9BACT|nr:GAF domain-containing protein [Fulvivirgaceae bacterium BMA12]
MGKRRSIHLFWNSGTILLATFIVSSYLFNFSTSTWRDELILLTLPVLMVLYFFGRKYFIKPIFQIQYGLSDVDGDSFSKVIEATQTVEFKEISQAINSIKKNVINASKFIESVEGGQLDITYSEDEESDNKVHDPLKGALVSMSAKMQEIAEEDKERNWIAEGLAKFIDLMRADNEDLKGLCNKIISNLVGYTGANQGGLFVLKREEEGNKESETWLELMACYAYSHRKYLEKRIEIGEGMLGQAFLEKETVHLKVVPDDYINITSGLGEAPPKNILIVPLKTNEEVYGLVELASFTEFQPYKIDFIERLGENIAATISSVQVNERTNNLLKDTQQQTEELRAQEEEMRQNQEEMKATQEAVERKQKELEISEKKSTAIFENSNDAILVGNKNGQINALNSSAKALFKVNDLDTYGNSNTLLIQQFIKKFDTEKPDFFFQKRRRTKAINTVQTQINVEVYMTKEDLGGELNYIMYVRDISKEVEKEHQIAQNLMYLDEMKAELKALKTQDQKS